MPKAQFFTAGGVYSFAGFLSSFWHLKNVESNYVISEKNREGVDANLL